MLSLRASNEGLLRPRVARAQEHDRRPRLFESFYGDTDVLDPMAAKGEIEPLLKKAFGK